MMQICCPIKYFNLSLKQTSSCLTACLMLFVLPKMADLGDLGEGGGGVGGGFVVRSTRAVWGCHS